MNQFFTFFIFSISFIFSPVEVLLRKVPEPVEGILV